MFRRIPDFSKWQGDIPWPVVAKQPIGGVYIKATEGLVVDEKFKQNLLGARGVGLQPGAYVFVRPEVDPAKQAQCLMDNAPRMPTDLPPAIDVEFTKRDGLDEWLAVGSQAQRLLLITETLQAIKDLGILRPRIYISKAFVDQYLPQDHNLTSLADLWVPWYGRVEPYAIDDNPTFNPRALPHGWADWAGWQYGQVVMPGVGVVDSSFFRY